MSAAIRMDGKETSAELLRDVKEKVSSFTQKNGRAPGLTVILAGDDPASAVYVRNKHKRAEEVGIRSDVVTLPADCGEAAVLSKIAELNADPNVDGILVQLPLPDGVSSERALHAIDPKKDVDGFHPVNMGALAVGSAGVVPCTPKGCMVLLKKYVGDLSGKHAVVIGRSNIVGKPMALLLLAANCTVTVAHSRTKNIEEIVRGADIVVAAVGRAEMVKGDWIKPGAAVVDVGINRIDAEGGKSKLVGDVDFVGASENASCITPVPGGAGPMTIACLLQNTLEAATVRVNASVKAA